MEELKKTSLMNLMNLWIDMMRANTEHLNNPLASKWHSSIGFNKAIENIEVTLSEKLQITLLEVKIVLNSKKKVTDARERELFKTKKRKVQDEKREKYLTNLSMGMGKINQEIFHAHHAVCKLEELNDNKEENEL